MQTEAADLFNLFIFSPLIHWNLNNKTIPPITVIPPEYIKKWYKSAERKLRKTNGTEVIFRAGVFVDTVYQWQYIFSLSEKNNDFPSVIKKENRYSHEVKSREKIQSLSLYKISSLLYICVGERDLTEKRRGRGYKSTHQS